MKQIVFDYSELEGRMITKFGSRKAFAEAAGIGNNSLSMKLSNKTKLTTYEVLQWASVLEIARKDIVRYFFTTNVQVM